MRGCGSECSSCSRCCAPSSFRRLTSPGSDRCGCLLSVRRSARRRSAASPVAADPSRDAALRRLLLLSRARIRAAPGGRKARSRLRRLSDWRTRELARTVRILNKLSICRHTAEQDAALIAILTSALTDRSARFHDVRRFVIFVGPIEFVSPTDADSTLRRSAAVANAQSDSVMVSARARERERVELQG